MTAPYIMPMGFIDWLTEDGAVIQLTNPGEPHSVRQGAPVTVAPVTVRRYSPGHLALGKLRGRITQGGYTTAKFATSDTKTDPRWPGDEPVLRPAAPVFLALRYS